MEKHSWLWWLGGGAKDAEATNVADVRRQTDQRARRQDTQKKRADETERNNDG